jgi:hypothetical protein
MFSRISNSWALVKASFAVLRSDKELLLFPIVSALASIIVVATFAVPMLLAGFFDSLLSGSGNGPLSIIIGFLFYVVMYTVVIFSNAALIGAASIRLNGGDPTLRDGFRIASEHLGSILGYAAISATVGIILRAISERGGVFGQIVSGVIGFAWGVVTFLVVPILVIENIGPVDAIKRSGQLLRQTWGEQLIGNFSIGLIFGLLGIGLFALIGLPLILIGASIDSLLLIALAFAVIVLGFIGLGLVSGALNGIYAAAVYNYATNNAAGEFFPQDLVQGAFRRK